MAHLSIRNRLLSVFLVLITLTIAALGSYFLWYFHRYNISNLTTHLVTHAHITEQFVREYLGGIYDRHSLDNKIKEISTSTAIRITVIETDGTVLADSWENPSSMDNHRTRPEVSSALTGHQDTATRYSSTLQQNALYVAVPVFDATNQIRGVVRVSSTLTAVDAGFAEIRSAIFTALFLTLCLASLISLRLARQFTAPLESMTRLAKEIGAGHLEQRLHIRTGDELEVLAHTLNNLASNLDDTLAEIKEEKSKLELILSHMDNGLFLLDRQGRITNANRKAKELFNLKASMLGQHNLTVLGYNQFDVALRKVVAEHCSLTLDLRTSAKDANRFFQIFLGPIESEKGVQAVLAVFHDITALKELQERQAEFINNASHELATPLTSIKGFAETLLSDDPIDAALQQKFVRIIFSEAERMQRLVQDLLQLARLQPEEYRKQVSFQNIEMTDLLHEVIQEFAPRFAKKELHFSSNCAEVSPSPVWGHGDYLKQVLINLLDNACKYTPSGGRLTLHCSQANERLYIALKDSGIGIQQQHLPLLLDRFYRVDKSRSRQEGGTGLGLSIVKFILDLHDGTIDFVSKPDEGTTVTISLPLATKQDHTAI
ncbi:sensor histidine kinase [Azotosporobacter soli]|uniref:sensor histidine kinase n=1 Tax=Azotosporobacter soli TaxID=3055040 RepID=UPI0031FED204